MSNVESQRRALVAGIAIFLLSLCWIVFGQTRRFDFVNFDDQLYVYDNALIRHGLSWPGLGWMLSEAHGSNWHPLTTFSHMLDCQLFGVNAGAHHLVNLFFHSMGVVLLFVVLRAMTSATWRSALVAALFAIHPQHVESVAWISERKDVLSGFFFMLTLAAYVHYVRQPSRLGYLLLLLAAAGGLLAKPMLVTLPFVLLLLDYWPLRRFVSVRQAKQTRRLFLEKVPILILALTISVITYVIQVTHDALNDSMPLAWRAGNAVSSYYTYLQQMIWPANLAAFYPHPEDHLSLWKIASSLVILVLISALVFFRRRRNPYLLVGWLWYLGMLLPVIGLLQVGTQGWADRYSYLPGIGIYLALVWLVADLTIRLPYRRQVAAIGAAGILTACALVARKQTQFWRDSETLWNRALAVTKENHLAQSGLGALDENQGRLDQALSRYRTAAEIRERLPRTHDLLLATYNANIAGVLLRQGHADEAINYCRVALDFQPSYAQACRIWGDALMYEGHTAEAIPLFRQAAETYLADPQFHYNFGEALLSEGEEEEAVAHLERALVFDHDSLPALNDLAWIYATSSNPQLRHGKRAVLMAERAVQLSAKKEPFYIHKLAAAYAEDGNFPEAIAAADYAKKLALDQGNAGLADELQRNIDIYRMNSPLRDRRRPR